MRPRRHFSADRRGNPQAVGARHRKPDPLATVVVDVDAERR